MASSGLPASRTGGIDIDAFLRRLETRLRSATTRLLPDVPIHGLLSLFLCTPELVVAQTCGVRHGDLYWAKPATGLVRIGVGRAFSWDGKGQDRWSALNSTLTGLRERWLTADPDGMRADPCAFVGVSFDPEADPQQPWAGTPNSALQVPEVLYTRRGSECYLSFTLIRGPRVDVGVVLDRWRCLARDLISRLLHPDDPPRARSDTLRLQRIDDDAAARRWSAQVGAALDAIRRAEFEKIVLSRLIRARAPGAFKLGRMLEWLEVNYPNGIHFAVRLAGRTLVGVTPERLVCLSNGTAISDAIAGTRPQGCGYLYPVRGHNPLFDDFKTRREQRLVVDDILHALRPVSQDITTVNQPLILNLPNVQHLWTPIRARIHKGVTLLDLAQRLHPTSAVSGTPRNKALLWLKEHGESWRGWYTGALGWATHNGEGELAVALRCALLEDNEACLFAGAGILRESNPHQEYLETEWKLQSMLEALSHA